MLHKYFGWSIVFLCWLLWVNCAMCMAMTFILLSKHFAETIKKLLITMLCRKPKCGSESLKKLLWVQSTPDFSTTKGEILVKTMSVIQAIIGMSVWLLYLYILLTVGYHNWKQSNWKCLEQIKINILAWLK